MEKKKKTTHYLSHIYLTFFKPKNECFDGKKKKDLNVSENINQPDRNSSFLYEYAFYFLQVKMIAEDT